MNETAKALRKALKKRRTFANGTVIRWTSAGRYLYVAIYIADLGLWYTSIAESNRYLSTVVDSDDLLDYLKRSDVTDVAVATEWEVV